MGSFGKQRKYIRAVPLQAAVLCADCETISNSAHDVCVVCGGHSLVNFSRMMGGICSSANVEAPDVPKYDVAISLSVSGVTAHDLNDFIASLTNLIDSNASAVCHSFHVNAEPIVRNAAEAAGKAA